MSDHKFDELTKGFATTTSRRGFLKTLVAGATALALGGTVLADDYDRCYEKEDDCKKYCDGYCYKKEDKYGKKQYCCKKKDDKKDDKKKCKSDKDCHGKGQVCCKKGKHYGKCVGHGACK